MHRNLWIATAAAATLSIAVPVSAGENPKDVAFQVIDRNTDTMTKIGDSIYYFAELGMQEFESAKLPKEALETGGFTVELGGAGMPTNVWAKWGSGKPVIAIVTEVDALQEGSQTPNVFDRKPLVDGAPGHWRATTPTVGSPRQRPSP
jgi:aminobenzoyl-glutamate utilization protein B